MKNTIRNCIFIPLLFLLFACSSTRENKLIIFHAGSLSVPLDSIASAYEARNPKVEILLEGAGSRECARKITEIHRNCDVFASADYTVIEDLLIPEYASWFINFAANEMCIAYTKKSSYSDVINKNNWPAILLSDDVYYGRSNPNLDPCGYRTVLCLKLSESFYNYGGLVDDMLAKNSDFIRPKETDLLALLESGTIDYIFIYRSVAQQHGLEYIVLPDSINLKEPSLSSFYQMASVDITGKTNNETITKIGEPMIYGLCIPQNSPSKELAFDFVNFMLSNEGMDIMESMGQASLIPACCEYYSELPNKLKKYAKDCKQ
jgi:molybdate/tungstate transport system substrate-binding protein